VDGPYVLMSWIAESQPDCALGPVLCTLGVAPADDAADVVELAGVASDAVVEEPVEVHPASANAVPARKTVKARARGQTPETYAPISLLTRLFC
jgi:hypothetical protein